MLDFRLGCCMQLGTQWAEELLLVAVPFARMAGTKSATLCAAAGGSGQHRHIQRVGGVAAAPLRTPKDVLSLLTACTTDNN